MAECIILEVIPKNLVVILADILKIAILATEERDEADRADVPTWKPRNFTKGTRQRTRT